MTSKPSGVNQDVWNIIHPIVVGQIKSFVDAYSESVRPPILPSSLAKRISGALTCEETQQRLSDARRSK